MAHLALGLETTAKPAIVQVLRDARQDAAAQDDATPCARDQGNIANKTAQHYAIERKRARTGRIDGIMGPLGNDIGSCQARSLGAVKQRQGIVHPRDAIATKNILGRNVVSKLRAQVAQEFDLKLPARGEVAMPAFCCDRSPTRGISQQSCHPKSGTGTNDGDRRRRAGMTTADLHELIIVETRHRQGESFKIIDQPEAFDR